MRFALPVTRLQKLALSLCVLVLGLVASEAGLRIWLRLHGRPYSAWRTLQAIEHDANTTRAFVPRSADDKAAAIGLPPIVLHPYYGAENQHDSGGVLEYFRKRARPEHYKVLVLGGSVAAGFANTLLKRLPALLQGAPGIGDRRVTVENGAHAAYKQPQQVMRLAYLLSFGYRPDAVIEIDGFNEVTFGPENAGSGVNPNYPAAPVWGAYARDFGLDVLRQAPIVARMIELRSRIEGAATTAKRWHLYESGWLGRFTLARMSKWNDEIGQLQKDLLAQSIDVSERMHRQLDGPDFDHAQDAAMTASARCWFECALSLQDLCAARGIRYVHILQPTLHDPGAKLMSAEEKALPIPSRYWVTGPRVGYPLLRARIDELRAHGVHFLDETHVFEDVHETLYFDACHLLEKGEQIWFERMASDLRTALVGP